MEITASGKSLTPNPNRVSEELIGKVTQKMLPNEIRECQQGEVGCLLTKFLATREAQEDDLVNQARVELKSLTGSTELFNLQFRPKNLFRLAQVIVDAIGLIHDNRSIRKYLGTNQAEALHTIDNYTLETCAYFLARYELEKSIDSLPQEMQHLLQRAYKASSAVLNFYKKNEKTKLVQKMTRNFIQSKLSSRWNRHLEDFSKIEKLGKLGEGSYGATYKVKGTDKRGEQMNLVQKTFGVRIGPWNMLKLENFSSFEEQQVVEDTSIELSMNAQLAYFIYENIAIIAKDVFQFACTKHLVPCLSVPAPQPPPGFLMGILTGIGRAIRLLDQTIVRSDSNSLFYECCKGKPLHKAIENCSFKQRLEILRDVCQGLSLLHAANIIHRDLKNDNIMVKINKNSIAKASIIDLGLAIDTRNPGKFGELHAQTHPPYGAPPEAFKDCPPEILFQPSYDIYELGLLIPQIMFSGIAESILFGGTELNLHANKEGIVNIGGQEVNINISTNAEDIPFPVRIHTGERVSVGPLSMNTREKGNALLVRKILYGGLVDFIRECRQYSSFPDDYYFINGHPIPYQTYCFFTYHLMKQCLAEDPAKRPSANDLARKIEEFFTFPSFYDTAEGVERLFSNQQVVISDSEPLSQPEVSS